MSRKVHLRPNRVIWVGKAKTYCGMSLFPRENTSGAVVTFGTFDGRCSDIEVTIHGALVTCNACLDKLKATQ